MKRRKFLKCIGLGTVATAATTFLLKYPDRVVEPIKKSSSDVVAGNGWISQIENKGNIYKHTDHDELVKAMRDHYAQYPLTPEEAFKSKFVS